MSSTSNLNATTTRRECLRRMGGLMASASLPLFPQAPPEPAQGTAPIKEIDEALIRFLKENETPGCALVVAIKGEIVYSRGLGYADVDSRRAMPSDALFRIGSVSKTLTALAIMQCIETMPKQVNLDSPVAPLFRWNRNSFADPRISQITVRHLLQHTGGWDRSKSPDPLFMPFDVARALDVECPPNINQIIQYQLTRPLDFDPGDHQVYSNFGYSLLGRLIERLTGETYEKYVRSRILAPLGITRMKLGRSLLKTDGEVSYYEPELAPVEPVFPELRGRKVPLAYGGYNHEAIDSAGGWIGSALDLVRFAQCLDTPEKVSLKPDTIKQIMAPPQVRTGGENFGKPGVSHIGCGWMVVPAGADTVHSWHTGHIWGATSRLAHLANGVTYAILFNRGFQPGQASKQLIMGNAVTPVLEQAIFSCKPWLAKLQKS